MNLRADSEDGSSLAAARDYISGRRFADGFKLPIKRATSGRDRLSLLVELARDKRVVDLGFADHLDQIDPKRAAGTWLHGMLREAAEVCLGIDLNAVSVDRARSLGYVDVVVGDIANEDIPEVFEGAWDLLVLGEILEHVDDPVTFLRSIRERYGPRLPQLVISVPNALSLQTAYHALRGVELVNSDHRYWFTPYTLAKVVSRAGYVPEWFVFCDPAPVGPRRQGPIGLLRRVGRRVVYDMWPHLLLDLVLVARYK